MALLDRLAARLGYTRAAAPRPLRLRQFAAAENSQLTHGWSSTDWHINQALYRSLRTLRARSRDLARNNDYARKFLGLVKSNVIGPTGISLQVHAKKRDGSIDEPDSARCESVFAAWSRREHCDFKGELSWLELQGLYVETLARDGEVLVRRVRGRGPFGYQLQFLDPALLDERYNTDLPGGRRIRMGIELDGDGRRLAYHLAQDDVADPQKLIVFARRFVRVPAEEIWHDFITEQVGQLRGAPWMCSTLIRQKRLGSFEDAAVAAAEEGAKKLAWLKTPSGDLKPLADQISAEGQPDIPAPQQGTLYTDSGGIHYAGLPPGYELQSWDPKYPDQAFGDFVKAQLRGIASGLGVTYHSLANDLEGVNFSSTRAGELEARAVWKALQQFVIDRLCARAYSEGLPLFILTGQLALPMEKLAKFDAAVWQGVRWSWVDPEKDVNAHVTAIDNGLTSRSRVIREMGHDPEEVWAELEREKERLKDLLPEKKQQDAPKPPAKPEAEPGEETKALLLAAAQAFNREPAPTVVNVSPPAVTVDARTSITNQIPKRGTVEKTVTERDAHGLIKKTVEVEQ